MEDPKEFLDSQFMKSSHERLEPSVHFYDTEVLNCPFCGKQMKSAVKDGYKLYCECDDYQKVEQQILQYNNLDSQIDQLVKTQAKIIEDINNAARAPAYKVIARHYFENEKKREEFNKEIKSMTNL